MTSHPSHRDPRLAAAVRVDEEGRIVEDLPCPQCGYNLRMLTAKTGCPECGTAVQRAVWVARLRWNDPHWLRKMAAASAWFGIGVASFMVLVALGVALEGAYLLAIAAPIAASVVTTVYGCVLATTPNPDVLRREGFVSRRRLARWSIIGALVGVVAGILVMSFDAIAGERVLSVAAGAIPIAVILTLLHGRRTAAQIDQWELVWATRGFILIFVLASFLVADLSLGGGWFYEIIWLEDFRWWLFDTFGIGLGEATVMLSTLVLGVLSFPLMWGYHRRLLDAANMASRRLEQAGEA